MKLKAAKLPVLIFRYEDNGFYVIFIFVEVSVQQQVLGLIKEDPKMTVVKISELLSVNSRTVLRVFKNLQENSIIERLGNNRTGEWRIL